MKFPSHPKRRQFSCGQGCLLRGTSAQDLIVQEKIDKIVNNFQFIKTEWNIFNSDFFNKSILNKISVSKIELD